MSTDTMNYATRSATALNRFPAVVAAEALGVLKTLAATALAWQERARHRHALAELDDRTLADVGLTRADVDRQISRPVTIF